MNHSITEEVVCRTAPATPGLLNIPGEGGTGGVKMIRRQVMRSMRSRGRRRRRMSRR